MGREFVGLPGSCKKAPLLSCCRQEGRALNFIQPYTGTGQRFAGFLKAACAGAYNAGKWGGSQEVLVN